MNRIFTLLSGILLLSFAFSMKVSAQNTCNCWQIRDSSFHPVPFLNDYLPTTPPQYRNDDGYTNVVTIPFHLCFWGKQIDSLYINNNGNISFGAPYSTFTSDSFPNSSFSMIAPFWGDVDTRPAGLTMNWNMVYYKITSTYMVVQWDSVGVYKSNSKHDTDQLNSFQLIITNGSDPIVPNGNNVEFCYKEMQWASGTASGGDSAGFGGFPATVGANKGDGTNFVQFGLFDSPGNTYYGQFPPGPNYDGVGWLVNKTLAFNVCSNNIPPLTSGITPCDTFKICLGDSVLIPLYFFTPIQGDSVFSKLSPPIPPGVSVYSNKPGPYDSLTILIVGSASNLGYHTINVYGYDNNVPSDTTFTSFVVEVDSAPTNVRIAAHHDTICLGDTVNLIASGGKYYTWSTGATNSSITVTPTITQTYTVGVSTGGCVKDTMIKVYVYTSPSPTITAKPDTICPKDSVLLIGSGATIYNWSTGKTTDSIWVTPDSTTIYNLSGSNGFCVSSTSVKVFVKTIGNTTLTHSTDTLCPKASFTVTANGGTSYLWSNGATTSSIVVNPDSTTTYTVISHVTCAVDSIKQQVVIIPLPKPKITGPTWKCKGVHDTISVSSSTSPTTYVWSNGKTTTTITTGPIDGDSTVSVTAYNKLGCDTTITFDITERIAPTVKLNPPTVACSGTPVTLIATGIGTNAPFTFTWSTGQTSTSSSKDTIVVIPNSDTTISVTVSNGCASRATTTLVPNTPNLYACCDKTILVGEDTTIVAFNDSMKSYTWAPDSGLTCLNPICDSVLVKPSVTTAYTVTGTDNLGCQVSRVVIITVEVPCFNLTIPNVITPNNPGPFGYNNEFYIKTEHISAWSLTIFDRWGKEMYSSSNPDQYWNGTTKSGDEASDGIYYYILTGTCQNVTYKKEGFVQLIR